MFRIYELVSYLYKITLQKTVDFSFFHNCDRHQCRKQKNDNTVIIANMTLCWLNVMIIVSHTLIL